MTRPLTLPAATVRVALAGETIQIRRPMKPQPYCSTRHGHRWFWSYKGYVYALPTPDDEWNFAIALWNVCPLGRPGSTFWVRETWHRDQSGGLWGYYADYDPPSDGFGTNVGGRKVPASQMPRWASRLTLVLLSVTVERTASGAWE